MLAPIGAMIIALITHVSGWNHYEDRLEQAIENKRLIREQRSSSWEADPESVQ